LTQHPQASLARTALIKMGVRIAIVIALTTLVSYLHIFRRMRDSTLSQLAQHVAERAQREQSVFLLAQDNHAVLNKALEERIRAWRQQDPNPRFDSLFAHLPDGTIRSRAEGFDGTRMAGAFTPRGAKDDEDFRRRLLASYEVVTQYGPAFHTRFMDTYVLLPEGSDVVYWPEDPNWALNAEPTFLVTDFEYFTQTLPQNNPRRETVWSGIFEDAPSRKWMVSVTTPLDVDGHHVATVGHDVLLDELMARTVNEHLPGAYNLVFRDDGQLIAHPEMRVESGKPAYNILGAGEPGSTPGEFGTAEQRAHLRAIFERVKNRPPAQTVLELPEHEEYLAVARLRGPEWNFVTVLPEREVSSAALAAARYVLAFGLASLLLELFIVFWVLRELEQRIEARTRELRDVQSQLVDAARRAGMAEVATNVLHNVGNVLNSVSTAAMLARERLAGLRLAHVTRVANLLEEHRSGLGPYLTEDERGRKIVPFLKQLGSHMDDEHKELRALLSDVNRYTEHIGTIVKLQQGYARHSQVKQPVLLEELLDEALRINEAALARHGVTVERILESLPPVLTERHKVLMILINLISNAKYAMDGVPEDKRRLTLRVARVPGDRVQLEVRDTGVGIAPELLTRIFQHGFSTREQGHGFGLHSSALAARELGGTLSAHSDGPGQGASFVLELPLHSTEGAS
jgi:signal transduction histidine kinase